MKTLRKYVYSILILLMFNSTFACDDVYSPATLKDLPLYWPPHATMTYGITSFRDYNGCTLNCRCVYDSKASTWKAETSKPNETCVFENQCKTCKSTDKECKVGFIIPTMYTYYEAIYYSNPATKPNMQQCIHYKDKPVKCEKIISYPPYDLLDHGSG